MARRCADDGRTATKQRRSASSFIASGYGIDVKPAGRAVRSGFAGYHHAVSAGRSVHRLIAPDLHHPRALRGNTFAVRRVVIRLVRWFPFPIAPSVRLSGRSAVGRGLVVTLAVALAPLAAWASAPCEMLLATYLVEREAEVQPCLVDLQESGLCFEVPGTGLGMIVRTLDNHLQTLGVPRPVWEPGLMSEATRFDGPTGDRIEIVLSALGPFETIGSCRVVPQR